jgi:hypothetical protein
LGLDGIEENKIYGTFRAQVIDGTKGTFSGFALGAVNFLRKWSTGRPNANGPGVSADSLWRFKIDAPDVIVWNGCKNDCTDHAAVAARPSLLNGNAGSGFHDCDLYCSITAGSLRMGHPDFACGQLHAWQGGSNLRHVVLCFYDCRFSVGNLAVDESQLGPNASQLAVNLADLF